MNNVVLLISAYVEWGAVAPGGKQLQPNWYPCPSKVMMRMRGSDPSSAPSRQIAEPVLLENAESVRSHVPKSKSTKQASLFRASGLPSEASIIKKFTAMRSLAPHSSVHSTKPATALPEGSEPHRGSYSRPWEAPSPPPTEPNIMPSSRNHPNFELTGTTPRPLSRGQKPSSAMNKERPPVVLISFRSGDDDSASKNSRVDYSKIEPEKPTQVVYVDDVFPEDINSADASSKDELFELRNRFAEELMASLPPVATPTSRDQSFPQPLLEDTHFDDFSRPPSEKGGRPKRDHSQSSRGSDIALGTPALDEIKYTVSSKNTSGGGGGFKSSTGSLRGPQFRGVEGHRSDLTYGRPAAGISVLKPVTKSIALNRSFKVTLKHH